MASELVKELVTADVNETSLKQHGVALVDFWAPWCGPCRMMAPIIDELAAEYEGKVAVGKINIDDHTDAASAYNVASIPTLVVFKDGKEVERIVGVRNKGHFQQILDKYI